MRSRRPDFRLAVVGTGAAFLRGFAERAPDRYAVAIDRDQGGSVALAAAYDVIKTTGPGSPAFRTCAMSPCRMPRTSWPTRRCGRRHAATCATPITGCAGRSRSRTPQECGGRGRPRRACGRSPDGVPRGPIRRPDVATAIAETLPGRARTRIGSGGSRRSPPAMRPWASTIGWEWRPGDPARRDQPARGRLPRSGPERGVPRVRPGALPRLASPGTASSRTRPSSSRAGPRSASSSSATTGASRPTSTSRSADPIYADHILERLRQRVTHEGVTFVLDKYDAGARKGTWHAETAEHGSSLPASLDFSPRALLLPATHPERARDPRHRTPVSRVRARQSAGGGPGRDRRREAVAVPADDARPRRLRPRRRSRAASTTACRCSARSSASRRTSIGWRRGGTRCPVPFTGGDEFVGRDPGQVIGAIDLGLLARDRTDVARDARDDRRGLWPNGQRRRATRRHASPRAASATSTGLAPGTPSGPASCGPAGGPA